MNQGLNAYSNSDYPPRIIAVWGSTWLTDGKSQEVHTNLRTKHSVQATRDGAICYLTQTHEKTGEAAYDGTLRVNGEPITARYTLHDGDFIQMDTIIPAVFQADPVGDKQRRADGETSPVLALPSSVSRYVAVDADGVTVSGRHLNWRDIACVLIDHRYHKARITFSAIAQKEHRLILKARDMDILRDTLIRTAPFDLNVYSLNDRDDLGYQRVAQTKIIEPAERAGLSLPAPRDIILPFEALRERQKRRRQSQHLWLLLLYGGIAFSNVAVFLGITATLVLVWGIDRLFPFANDR